MRSGFVNGSTRIQNEQLPDRFSFHPTLLNTRFATPSHWEPYDPTEPPVIFGHYWLPKHWPPAPILPNVICVDYSAGKSGPLAAYSFHLEREREGEFIAVEGATR